VDKRVVLAVAGAGKTTFIIDQLEEISKALLITYTENNTRNLRQRIINKFGYIPKGIKILSYFSYIYSYCLKPLYGYELNLKGINFIQSTPPQIIYTKKDSKEHYIDSENRIYSNRISKMILEKGLMPAVLTRLERYFNAIYIDEIQDFSANDFNFVCELSKLSCKVILVGDFYQHTFDTSRDGNTQRRLHSCIDYYTKKIKDSGYKLDELSLSKSYRCPPDICKFVTDNLGINIESHGNTFGTVRLIEDKNEIEGIFNDDSIIKLFYRSSNKYPGNTDNWGNVKGLDDFDNVCVVLNKNTMMKYHSNSLTSLKPTTKNKFYVACTRAKKNLFFIDERKIKKLLNN